MTFPVHLSGPPPFSPPPYLLKPRHLTCIMRDIVGILLLASFACIGSATLAPHPAQSSSSLRPLNPQAANSLKSRSTSTTRTTSAEYLSHAQTAFEVLQKTWYNESTGLWGNQWWNSANALTTLVQLRGLDPSIENLTDTIYSNIYV